MTVRLKPKEGFDWTRVGWGGPDEPAADDCSYCDAPIPDDAVPLMFWNDAGWCARFCDDCVRRWWSVERT